MLNVTVFGPYAKDVTKRAMSVCTGRSIRRGLSIPIHNTRTEMLLNMPEIVQRVELPQQ